MEGRLRKSQMMLPAGYNINKLPEGYVLISNFKKQEYSERNNYKYQDNRA